MTTERETIPRTHSTFWGTPLDPVEPETNSGCFLPVIFRQLAISNKAKVAIQQTIQGWRLHLRSDKTLAEISQMYNPRIQGWANYYGRFYKSDMCSIYYHLNLVLIRWAMRKYKKLRAHKLRACKWLARIARQKPELFVHWQMGVFPGAMGEGSRMS